MPEFRYKPTEPHFKYLAHSGGTLPSTSAVSSGTQVSALSDAYGRLSIQGAAPINSSTAGLYPVFMGGYHQSTGSLVPLPVTDTGLKVDTELEVTGTLIANLYTFKDYSGSIQAALVDSNRRQEVILASGTCVAGTIDARCTQVTDPWAVSGTVTSSPSGTQDVDIVAQSLSKLNVGISDTTSTVNAVIQADNADLMKSTGGTVTVLGKPSTSADHNRYLIGTSSTQILDANPDRVSVLIVNGSDNEVFIGLGTTASTLGIPFFNKGDSYEINQTNRWTGAVSAIASAANSTIYVTEF